MKFQPNGNRVMVDLDEVSGQTEGGLYIPQTASEGPKRGTVVASGLKYVVGSVVVESPFQSGDKVLVDCLGATNVRVGGKEYVLVRHEDVLGKYVD